jgi:hypothetical protein
LVTIIFIPKRNSKINFVLASLLGIAVIYLLFVVFFFPVKNNNSFFRYSTLFFFLIPYTLSFDIKLLNKNKVSLVTYSFIVLALLNFFLSNFKYQEISKANHTGKYSSFSPYRQYEQIALRTKQLIGDENILVINGNKKIYIREKSVLMVRYNLINNVKGGIRFQTRNTQTFRKFLSNNDIRFVLVQNPQIDILKELFNYNFGKVNKNSFFLIRINDLENDNFTITPIAK